MWLVKQEPTEHIWLLRYYFINNINIGNYILGETLFVINHIYGGYPPVLCDIYT